MKQITTEEINERLQNMNQDTHTKIVFIKTSDGEILWSSSCIDESIVYEVAVKALEMVYNVQAGIGRTDIALHIEII